MFKKVRVSPRKCAKASCRDEVVIIANGTEVHVSVELWREFRNIAGRLIDSGDIESARLDELKELSGELFLQLPPPPRDLPSSRD